MFETLKRAVTRTERTNLNALYARAMSHYANGRLTDDEFMELSARIDKQRRSIFPPKRRRNRRPVTELILAHRRKMAASGPMPAHLAAGFTTCELAVLAVITICKGRFDRSIEELADRAKVAPRTVQKALRKAERVGLIQITERRERGKPSAYNLVEVVSREWMAWIYRGGCKRLQALDTKYINSCNVGVSKLRTLKGPMNYIHIHPSQSSRWDHTWNKKSGFQLSVTRDFIRSQVSDVFVACDIGAKNV